MVHIKKRTVSGKGYYYLEHSLRVGEKVGNKTKYLGGSTPQNIEKLKKEFMLELYKEKWFSDFEKIKARYQREQKSVPSSAKIKEKQTFAVKFTYNTQRIEGSTLSLRETANLLERGITPKEKPISDVLEAEAHKDVFLEMLDYKKDLSLQIVLFWHKKLFEKTKQDIAGKIRNHQVAISGSKFVPLMPAEIETELKEFFDWYNKNKGKLNAVELAALVHLKFVTIHPFADGNGRISRLMMNFVLHKQNYPMLDIVYEKRSSYYTALERSQIKKDNSPFLNWFFRRYLQEYRGFLK
ncbi:MAG: Fic family protein [Nanoarchaeota archaeon]|nr:Fic family protein [Nanoarchaeota archaeon]